MAHAKRPSNTDGRLTVKLNIINAQVMEVRGQTIMETTVGAITNGVDLRIIIGTIAQVAVS